MYYKDLRSVAFRIADAKSFFYSNTGVVLDVLDDQDFICKYSSAPGDCQGAEDVYDEASRDYERYMSVIRERVFALGLHEYYQDIVNDLNGPEELALIRLSYKKYGHQGDILKFP